MIDWTACADAERIPGKVSGQVLVKGTRLPVQGILDHAASGYTPEEIASEIFDGITAEVARRIIQFASTYEARPA